MELTEEHYRLGKIAYDGYCKQTGGRLLVNGKEAPNFELLHEQVRDAWAAAAIAVALEVYRSQRRAYLDQTHAETNRRA